MSHICHAFGLPVATRMTIPGAFRVLKHVGVKPAFAVEHGGLELKGEEQGFAAVDEGPYRLGSEGLLFEKQGVAKFLCCQGGERLVVDPVTGAQEKDVAAYLIATAIPALLWMRGETVMHGAVALVPDTTRAIGILGASGSGKSRLLLEIAQAGGRMVAEDSFRVWSEGPRVMAAGLPGLIYERVAGATLSEGRVEHEIPAAQQMDSAELSVLVVLQTGGQKVVAEEPQEAFVDDPVLLHGIDALAAILRNRHRPRVPDMLGRSAGLLPTYGALARELPVYSWEFLQAASRSPGKGGTWRALAGLQHREG
jgi:hypothetical protein